MNQVFREFSCAIFSFGASDATESFRTSAPGLEACISTSDPVQLRREASSLKVQAIAKPSAQAKKRRRACTGTSGRAIRAPPSRLPSFPVAVAVPRCRRSRFSDRVPRRDQCPAIPRRRAEGPWRSLGRICLRSRPAACRPRRRRRRGRIWTVRRDT